MVRRIRDEQSRLLEGKSDAEIIAFFKKAGDAARRDAKKKQSRPTSRQRRRQA